MSFEKALKFVLRWEGGYVNNPSDKGGVTNKGITQRTYNAFLKMKGLPPRDVKLITDKEVSGIYYAEYWLRANCHKMNDKFAIVCFDTAVNMGVGRVKKFLEIAEYKDIKKFLDAREAKYREFANVKGQEIFLKGWLNRLNALRKEVECG